MKEEKKKHARKDARREWMFENVPEFDDVNDNLRRIKLVRAERIAAN